MGPSRAARQFLQLCRPVPGAAGLALLLALWPAAARGQGPPDLSDTVDVDRADSTARTYLEQVKTFGQNQQWDEAVETLRLVMANYAAKVMPLGDQRYVGMRDFCHRLLSTMPREALELYRSRVDDEARRRYEEAAVQRDEARLLEVVEQFYSSRWCDDALWTLGEMALEAGDFSAARTRWQQLLPSPAGDDGSIPLRLACVDPQQPASEVRARLVLVSILEGDLPRARRELEAFAALHPEARGRLAGREVDWGSALTALVEQAAAWSEPAAPRGWSTFGGTAQRNGSVAGRIDLGAMLWSCELDSSAATDPSVYRNCGFRPRRVAEDSGGLLSHHPVVHDGIVYLAGPRGISALELATGKPAWGRETPLCFSEPTDDLGRRVHPRSAVGVPRYTLTIDGDRLLARLGSPLTAESAEVPVSGPPSYLVCLDLTAQARLLWKIAPPGDGWAFEGTPLGDGRCVYVALRRRDVKPQAHVACYDADTGKLRWRSYVSAAVTPANGQYDECTHGLLTLAHGTLYYNTNLGAVAALSAADGRLRWLTVYPRASGGSLSRGAAHLYRDLNPCLIDRGRILVAPSDTPSILALDAGTGEILWESPYPDDAVHLLGVGGGHLVASGDRLWWIDVETGKITARWPDGPSPQGFGRGLLAGDEIYWPTREEIYVFDQGSAALRRVIAVTPRWPQATCGNMLAVEGRLLMVTSSKPGGCRLVAFTSDGTATEPAASELTEAPAAAPKGGGPPWNLPTPSRNRFFLAGPTASGRPNRE